MRSVRVHRGGESGTHRGVYNYNYGEETMSVSDTIEFYLPRLRAKAGILTRGNAADAEDLLSETTLLVVKKWENYDRDKPFLPWASRIMENKWIDTKRKPSSRFERTNSVEFVEANSINVEEIAMGSAMVEEFFKGLSEEEHAVASLLYQGASVRVIKQRAGISFQRFNTIRGRLRKKLAGMLRG